MAHDEKNGSKVGVTVIRMESRPLCRLKSWRMLKIVAKGV